MSGIFERQMFAGKIYARSKRRAGRLAFAREGIRAMLDAAPRAYLSLSWGKQSICLAHMIFEIAPETPMFFLASDESWDLHNFREVIDEFTGRWPINYRTVQTNRLFGAESWDEGRKAGQNDLQEMCRREEWDGWFWGLAKEESRVRRIVLLKNPSNIHRTIYRYKDGKLRCCPLMDWETDDIAAYVGEHDLPLLSIYRKYGLEMRTTARLTGTAVRRGGAWLRGANSRGVRKIKNRAPHVEGI